MIMLARESIENEPQINADERRLNESDNCAKSCHGSEKLGIDMSTYAPQGIRVVWESRTARFRHDERGFIAWDLSMYIIFLELDTIHDPFDFYPWLIEIDQKTKFETCYS